MTTDKSFADTLLDWFDIHGRHDLPWQHPRTPYRVWLSEVMLQQTQVTTVIPYFSAFLSRFPDLTALAAADLDDVLAAWAGLGYYSRARNLHRCAQTCVAQHGGDLPANLDALKALPGIGKSTAAAILSQAFGQPAAILDGNVKRLLSRHAGIEAPIDAVATERLLWTLAESRLPAHRAADYTQALMDFGATLCTPKKPACSECPLAVSCVSFHAGLVESIPVKRSRKAVPTRSVQMLVVMDGDRVLLERRPDTGVWGGLYSVPECEPDEDPEAVARSRFGLDVRSSGPGFKLRHRFTHFVLDITAVRVEVVVATSMSDGAAARFVDPIELAGLGLPKPVTKILRGQTSP